MYPRLRAPQLADSLVISPSSQSPVCAHCLHRFRRRHFSSTSQNATRQRLNMFRWLSGAGNVFRNPLPGSTNYLNAYDQAGNLIRARNMPPPGTKDNTSDTEIDGPEDTTHTAGEQKPVSQKLQEERKAARSKEVGLPKETAPDLMPFPMNPHFRSHPILSEELKNEIYKMVMEEGRSVRDVSAVLGVEMRRVGAVVRLKAVEKQWEKEGKPLTTAYAKAITAMLPQTPYIPHDPIPHESINDLPVHRATNLQVFHPVSESRHFTRRDAGKIFDRTLLPAEDRIPHVELYEMSRWKAEGIVPGERIRMRKEANEREANAKKELERLRREKDKLTVKKMQTSRWEFRFRDIQAESAGHDGRARSGVGARYGMPHEDRKRGQVKIPRSVQT